ncbi:MAG: N-acetylglucosaminyltransferase [Micrococcales bacterium]|nr:MAG: N-acetylglucosaminyltransferase [Micrococcales bacterium]
MIGWVVAVSLVVGLLVWPQTTLRLTIGLVSLGYLAILCYRITLVIRGQQGTQMVRISDAAARLIPDCDLPVYTVLVPAYREPEVIGKVISAMRNLEYPQDRLDVRLMLEADDEQTIQAARAALPAASISMVLVPPAEPRTKPKACNYGLLDSPGEFVTIFDAEDKPEPLQLRRAVTALRRLGPQYACVQAQLSYFNAHQNIITKWFTVEYANWFRLLLPGLVSVGAPLPLGGTSNHFHANVLRSVGAWDAFNVTEDADLGIRLSRLGYQVGVLDSVTLEEANSDFINWVKQRSRWYKGYLQTWLVHMRQPVSTHRELGWKGVLGLHLFILGTPLSAVLNPVFWALTVVWFVQQPQWLQSLFTGWVYYIALICLVGGNAAVVYMNVLTVRVSDKPELLFAALTTPLYWVMMSLAGVKAAYQLICQPSYWEKTTHGLFGPNDTAKVST